MTNVMITGEASTNISVSRQLIAEVLAAMNLVGQVRISWAPAEPKVTKEEILLYGYPEPLREAIANSLAIEAKTGVRVGIVPSECRALNQADSRLEAAGYLAVHATEERLEEIVQSLRGDIVTELGKRTFDVEKHILVPGIYFGMKPIYIKVHDVEHSRAIAITEGLARRMFNRRRIFTQQLAGFLTASEMEKALVC